MAKSQPSIVDMDLVHKVSTKDIKEFKEDTNKKVALIDCGVKRINSLDWVFLSLCKL